MIHHGQRDYSSPESKPEDFLSEWPVVANGPNIALIKLRALKTLMTFSLRFYRKIEKSIGLAVDKKSPLTYP